MWRRPVALGWRLGSAVAAIAHHAAAPRSAPAGRQILAILVVLVAVREQVARCARCETIIHGIDILVRAAAQKQVHSAKKHISIQVVKNTGRSTFNLPGY